MGQILSSGENAKATDDVRAVISPYISNHNNVITTGSRHDITSSYSSCDSGGAQTAPISNNSFDSGTRAVKHRGYFPTNSTPVSENNNTSTTAAGSFDNDNRNSTATIASKYLTPGTSFDDAGDRVKLSDTSTQTEALESANDTAIASVIDSSEKCVQTEEECDPTTVTTEDSSFDTETVSPRVECSVQTDVGAAVCCGCASPASSTSPSLSPQPLNDYLHLHSSTPTSNHRDDIIDDRNLLEKAVEPPHKGESEELKALHKVSVVSEDSITEIECVELNAEPSANDETSFEVPSATVLVTLDESSDDTVVLAASNSNNDESESECLKWKAQYENVLKENDTLKQHQEQQKDVYENKLKLMREESQRMKDVMGQYENLMLEMTERSSERENQDATLSATIASKVQAEKELCKVENNLVQAYRRIEKLKEALDVYKKNEDVATTSLHDYQAKLDKSEARYSRLKAECAAKIDSANVEIAKIRHQKQIDLAGIEAALKKAEHRNASLEKDITRKTEECRELSQICDELILKVSHE